MTFTCNSTFIAYYVGCFVEDAIGGDLHPVGENDHISWDYFCSMHLLSFAIPQDFIVISAFGHLVQLIELSFFLVVADCGNQSAHNHSDHNGNTINPEHVFLLTREVFNNH